MFAAGLWPLDVHRRGDRLDLTESLVSRYRFVEYRCACLPASLLTRARSPPRPHRVPDIWRSDLRDGPRHDPGHLQGDAR